MKVGYIQKGANLCGIPAGYMHSGLVHVIVVLLKHHCTAVRKRVLVPDQSAIAKA